MHSWHCVIPYVLASAEWKVRTNRVICPLNSITHAFHLIRKENWLIGCFYYQVLHRTGYLSPWLCLPKHPSKLFGNCTFSLSAASHLSKLTQSTAWKTSSHNSFLLTLSIGCHVPCWPVLVENVMPLQVHSKSPILPQCHSDKKTLCENALSFHPQALQTCSQRAY